MKRLKKYAPFATGNRGEVAEGVTRIYTIDGFPLIEVFGTQEIADEICSAINKAAGVKS